MNEKSPNLYFHIIIEIITTIVLAVLSWWLWQNWVLDPYTYSLQGTQYDLHLYRIRMGPALITLILVATALYGLADLIIKVYIMIITQRKPQISPPNNHNQITDNSHQNFTQDTQAKN